MVLAKRAADHRKILAGDKYLAAVDLPVARHHAVSRHTSLIQVKIVDTGLQKTVHLHESTRIKQYLNPFPGRQFPGRVLLVDPVRAAAEQSSLSSSIQFLVRLIPIHSAPPSYISLSYRISCLAMLLISLPAVLLRKYFDIQTIKMYYRQRLSSCQASACIFCSSCITGLLRLF